MCCTVECQHVVIKGQDGLRGASDSLTESFAYNKKHLRMILVQKKWYFPEDKVIFSNFFCRMTSFHSLLHALVTLFVSSFARIGKWVHYIFVNFWNGFQGVNYSMMAQNCVYEPLDPNKFVVITTGNWNKYWSLWYQFEVKKLKILSWKP